MRWILIATVVALSGCGGEDPKATLKSMVEDKGDRLAAIGRKYAAKITLKSEIAKLDDKDITYDASILVSVESDRQESKQIEHTPTTYTAKYEYLNNKWHFRWIGTRVSCDTLFEPWRHLDLSHGVPEDHEIYKVMASDN